MATLDGSVALVTGASGGIGRAVCQLLAAQGADVVAHYKHDQAGVELAAKNVSDAGRQVEVIKADISVSAEVRAMVERAVQRFGRLDILVNNAGVFPRSWALEMPEDEWDHVIDTNLKGTFLCCQASARIMKAAGRGRIVNVTSTAAVRGELRGSHYCASKAGIAGLTRSLALEWAPDVLVNCVAPGLTDTPQPRQGNTEEQLVARAARMPLQRIGQPEDTARAVLFLVTDSSSWITGQTFYVNGGDMMV